MLNLRKYWTEIALYGVSLGLLLTALKAFQVGILITLISCICYVITWMIVYETLMTDFLEKYMQVVLNKMRESGASAEKIEQETQKMLGYKKMYENPVYRFGLTFIEPFPLGLLVTVISSLVLRKKVNLKTKI